MTTATEYREQLDTLKASIPTVVAEFVRGGFVSGAIGREFLTTVGLTPAEDDETRAAREALEAFQAEVRTAVDAVPGMTGDYRREALRRFGINA